MPSVRCLRREFMGLTSDMNLIFSTAMKSHPKLIIKLIMMLAFAAVLFAIAATAQTEVRAGGELLLNGTWETGLDRNYAQLITVPGLAQSAEKISPGTLWYRRTVELPRGDWTEATLCLKGARFAPAVRSEEHTSELQSLRHLVCRLLLEIIKKGDFERLFLVLLLGPCVRGFRLGVR